MWKELNRKNLRLRWPKRCSKKLLMSYCLKDKVMNKIVKSLSMLLIWTMSRKSCLIQRYSTWLKSSKKCSSTNLRSSKTNNLSCTTNSNPNQTKKLKPTKSLMTNLNKIAVRSKVSHSSSTNLLKDWMLLSKISILSNLSRQIITRKYQSFLRILASKNRNRSILIQLLQVSLRDLHMRVGCLTLMVLETPLR